MPEIKIIEGDCRVEMRRLIGQGRSVHSVITDPPYHLLSIVKRFGKEGSVAAQHGRDGAFNRISRGFAGQQWDGLDERGRQIAHDPRLWELCLALLKPGGFLLAFSSPKTGHRMATAIEDAGFVMHPFIGWINAQGLPKPHEAAPGWYHGQQTLRPALEPVYVAQRPFSERTGRKNFNRHGVGGYHIAACRFAGAERVTGAGPGKWPTNLATDGSPAVLAAFPGDLRGDSKGQYFPAFGYASKAKGADRSGLDHPTVKPVNFLRWLIRLVTPAGGIVLDPFGGSGSLGIAALREGCRSIVIEANPVYVADMRRRVRTTEIL